MSSSQKRLINFSLILNTYPNPSVPALISMLQDPSYQKVMNGRPLVYFYNAQSGTQAYISAMRAAASAAHMPTPFIVLMGPAGAVNPAINQLASIGADAASDYATPASGSYASLVSTELLQWYSTIANHAPQMVPWISMGWDPEPNILNPVPWISYPPSTTQDAMPWELAAHVTDAINFIKANPQITAANVALIYAWNEFGEGGWVCPSLERGTERIDALALALGNYSTAATSSGTKYVGASGRVLQTSVNNGDGSVDFYDRQGRHAKRYASWTNTYFDGAGSPVKVVLPSGNTNVHSNNVSPYGNSETYHSYTTCFSAAGTFLGYSACQQ